jgi:hypothetical protein
MIWEWGAETGIAVPSNAKRAGVYRKLP